jgi:hypothetical protein
MYMRYIGGVLTWFRDLYVGVLVIPLWLWSVYYRVDPSFTQIPHIAWIEKNWNLLCVVIFTHGALALWQYAEKANQARAEQKPAMFVTGCVWALAIALFLTGLGAILKSNGVPWGYGFLAGGVIGMPLLVFWIFGYQAYEHRDREKRKEEPGTNQAQTLGRVASGKVE